MVFFSRDIQSEYTLCVFIDFAQATVGCAIPKMSSKKHNTTLQHEISSCGAASIESVLVLTHADAGHVICSAAPEAGNTWT